MEIEPNNIIAIPLGIGQGATVLLDGNLLHPGPPGLTFSTKFCKVSSSSGGVKNVAINQIKVVKIAPNTSLCQPNNSKIPKEFVCSKASNISLLSSK